MDFPGCSGIIRKPYLIIELNIIKDKDEKSKSSLEGETKKGLLTIDAGVTADPTVDQIKIYATILADYKEHFSNKIAMVVKNLYLFGLGRMMEVFCKEFDIELRAFHDVNVAKIWLDMAIDNGMNLK